MRTPKVVTRNLLYAASLAGVAFGASGIAMGVMDLHHVNSVVDLGNQLQNSNAYKNGQHVVEISKTTLGIASFINSRLKKDSAKLEPEHENSF